MSIYVVQVIDETLRIGGIAIWLMREAKEDVKYQGMYSHEIKKLMTKCRSLAFLTPQK